MKFILFQLRFSEKRAKNVFKKFSAFNIKNYFKIYIPIDRSRRVMKQYRNPSKTNATLIPDKIFLVHALNAILFSIKGFYLVFSQILK